MLELNTSTEIVEMLVKKIEKTRKSKKITQKELASKAGIPYGTYRGLVDSNTISLVSFISIFQVLGLYNELNTLVENKKIKTIKEMKEEDKAWK